MSKRILRLLIEDILESGNLIMRNLSATFNRQISASTKGAVKTLSSGNF